MVLSVPVNLGSLTRASIPSPSGRGGTLGSGRAGRPVGGGHLLAGRGSPLLPLSHPGLVGRGRHGQRIKYLHFVKTLTVTRSLGICSGGRSVSGDLNV